MLRPTPTSFNRCHHGHCGTPHGIGLRSRCGTQGRLGTPSFRSAERVGHRQLGAEVHVATVATAPTAVGYPVARACFGGRDRWCLFYPLEDGALRSLWRLFPLPIHISRTFLLLLLLNSGPLQPWHYLSIGEIFSQVGADLEANFIITVGHGLGIFRRVGARRRFLGRSLK